MVVSLLMECGLPGLEKNQGEYRVVIPLLSSINMRDPFCSDEQLGLELPTATLHTKRNTTVALKSIAVSIYHSLADPESRLTSRDELLSVGWSTDLYIGVPMKNLPTY